MKRGILLIHGIVIILLTSSTNQGSVRDFVRIPTDLNNSQFISLFGGNRSDDELFGLPEEQLLYLLDRGWPSSYPKVENDFRILVPRLSCGVAPEGWFTQGGNGEKLIELLNKIKEMGLNGESNDELVAWEKKIRMKLEEIKLGRGVSIDQGTIDIGKGTHISYYGDCKWDFLFWRDLVNIYTIKDIHDGTTSSDTIPLGYMDPNIWRNCYPVVSVYVSRLNDGQPISSNDYSLQRDIRIDLTAEASGTIVSVTVVLFTGDIVSRKIIIP